MASAHEEEKHSVSRACESTVPELLAPAGGWTQLEAALRFGANAVYLGCDRFGMRQRADNFSLEDIAKAVQFAHEAQVRVYVTLNTLMDSHDIAALPAYLEALASAQVDAFIVSDLGAFSLAQKHAPQVALHISTQAGVCNAAAATRWYEMGAKRVVCAREMSLEEIASMRANTPPDLQLEVFVHGAMCVAVSGRCLLSAAMTGRSGNKGYCAQSCRWSYALVEESRPEKYFPIEEDVKGSYVFNAEDLCMLDHLDELRRAGIASFKIEGRNKKAFYVASVVHAYRAVLDGAAPDAVYPDLLAISHRPYGTGFYFGQPSQRLERDGYIKECLHVATVSSCRPFEEGCARSKDLGSEQLWQVEVLCQNRFCEGDELEVLCPHKPLAKLVVRNLRWQPEPSEDKPHPQEQVVEVANRSMARYRFVSPLALLPGDLLRIRTGEAID